MSYFKKAYPFEIKELSDSGEISGYGSVFGVRDKGGDIVLQGAFREAQNKTIPMLWQHNPSEPIGTWKSVREDEYGLKLEGQIVMETAKGREAHALMKAGAVTGLSIGYKVRSGGSQRDEKGRKLSSLDLLEVSPVTFPMLPEAQLTAVKSDATIRDWETFLRDVGGLSRNEAKAFCAEGFKALAKLRDEVESGEQRDNAIALIQSFSFLNGVKSDGR